VSKKTKIKKNMVETQHQKEFNDALVELELSDKGAADLFEHHPRTIRRWRVGDRTIPPSLLTLVRLLMDGTIDPHDIERTNMRHAQHAA